MLLADLLSHMQENITDETLCLNVTDFPELKDMLNTLPSDAMTINLSEEPSISSDNILSIEGTFSDTWPLFGLGNNPFVFSSTPISLTISELTESHDIFSVNVQTQNTFEDIPIDVYYPKDQPDDGQVATDHHWGFSPSQMPTDEYAISDILSLADGTDVLDTVPDTDGLLDFLLLDQLEGSFFPTQTQNTDILINALVAASAKQQTWSIGFLSISNIGFEFYKNYTPLGDPATSTAISSAWGGAIYGDITIGEDTFKIVLALVPDQDLVFAILADPDNGFPDLVDLARLVGGDNLANTVQNLGIDFEILDIGILFRLALADKNLELFFKSKIEFFGLPLEVSASLPELYLYGGLDPDMEQDIYAADVLNSNDSLPASTGVPDMWIKELTFKFDAVNNNYNLNFDIDDDWYIGLPGNESFALEEIMLNIGYNTSLNCFFSGKFNIAGIEFSISANHPSSNAGWTFAGQTSEGQELPVGELLDEIAELFGIDAIPEVIKEMYLTDVLISLNTATKSFHFTCKGVFPTHADDESEDNDDSTITDTKGLEIAVDIRLSTDITNPAVFKKKIGGQLYIADDEFELEFETDGTGDSFSASWQGETTDDGTQATLGINDLLKAIGIASAPIPSEFDIKLTSAEFDYCSTEKRFTFILTTSPDSFLFKDMIFDSKVITPTEGTAKRGYVFKIDFDDFSLSEIPLIGDTLNADTFCIKNTSVLISSDNYTNYDLPVAGKNLQGNTPTTVNITSGVSFTTSFQIGKNFNQSASNCIYNETQTAMTVPNSSQQYYVPTYKPSGTVFWLNVQKAVGPMHIQKIGVGWRDQKLCLMMDAEFIACGLTLGLIDFSLAASPSDISNLSFFIDGIDIDFKENPIEINGGLDRYKINDQISYEGQAVVKAGSINLSAFGGYENITDDGSGDSSPSMYIFAVLDIPLGGPSFFFVNGISGGFGYNRTLVLPTIQNLNRFPLVEAAMGDSDLEHVMIDMQQYITPLIGQVWLAFGLRFTSYELLQSLAMLTISFGTKLEICLFGSSELSIPSKLEPDVTPIAYAELVLDAVFSTETESITVNAELNPGAYILSKQCHLTGGFALSVWYGSQYPGDFVVSLGGYHPHYHIPQNYPQYIPRLGLNWQLSDCILIKGDIYFALTPQCIMSGGDLQVTFQADGLKAWFTAGANFLIYWKPFYYEATFGVDVGVSYTFQAFGSSQSISVSLGVDVELHGPNFGGSVYIDIYIISFTISFGESNPSPTPIDWSEFKESFLPQQTTSSASASDGTQSLKSAIRMPMLGETAIASPNDTSISPCFAKVTGGLVKDLSQSKTDSDNSTDGSDTDYSLDWIINPETFSIETRSAIPMKTANFNADVLDNSTWSSDFGITPMGLDKKDFLSDYTITVTDLKTNTQITEEDSGFAFDYEPIITSSPKSLWSGQMPDISSLDTTLNEDAFIANTLVGIRIKAPQMDPDQTCAADLRQLNYEPTDFSNTLNWPDTTPPSSDSFDQTESIEVISSTINDTSVSNTRNSILNSLQTYGLSINTAINVAQLQEFPEDDFIDPPVLSYLGEEKIN